MLIWLSKWVNFIKKKNNDTEKLSFNNDAAADACSMKA